MPRLQSPFKGELLRPAKPPLQFVFKHFTTRNSLQKTIRLDKIKSHL